MIRAITPSIPIPPPVDSTASGSSIKTSTALYPPSSSDTVARITNIRADVTGIGSTSPTTAQVIAS